MKLEKSFFAHKILEQVIYKAAYQGKCGTIEFVIPYHEINPQNKEVSEEINLKIDITTSWSTGEDDEDTY